MHIFTNPSFFHYAYAFKWLHMNISSLPNTDTCDVTVDTSFLNMIQPYTWLSFCLFTSLHCPLFSLALSLRSAADRGWPVGVGREPAVARNFQFQLDLTGVGGVQVGSVKIHQPLFLKIPLQHFLLKKHTIHLTYRKQYAFLCTMALYL